jgi:hypothetical protein
MVKSMTMKSLKAVPQLLLWLAVPAMASNHAPPPVQPAASFAAVEVHEDEKVAIAAEPYDTREKESIFRGDYLGHGVMPIRVIVTNNGNRPISLLEARITFITAAGNIMQVAQPADVQRLMNGKEHESGDPPPPNIKPMPKPNKREIDADFDAFEFRVLVVKPHSTSAGFLFYDVSALDHPLEGAKLHLRTLRDADGTELFDFEIPFEKYLKSKPGQAN